MEKPRQVTLDVSWSALLKVVALALSLWLIVLLREILIMLLVVFIFVAAVNPTISRMQKRMSRLWAVILFYAVMLLIVAAISYAFLPNLVRQIQELVHNSPAIIAKVRPWLDSIQGKWPEAGFQFMYLCKAWSEAASEGRRG